MSLSTSPDIVKGNLRAIFLMVSAMALFAIEDTLIKLAYTNISVGQILFILSGTGFLTFALVARIRRERLFTKSLLERPMLLRNVSDVVGAMFFVPALTLMPLSNVSAILQATPLVVTCGAALFLGDPVGWRRWTAILIGFAGVLIIVRPGMEGFNYASIFALIGVLGISARDLVTRKIQIYTSTIAVSASAYLAMTIPSFFLMMFQGGWQPVGSEAAWYLFLACVVGPFAYFIITLALRLGESSAVAPFRYARLICAMVLGAIVFGERPDFWMYVGSALIIFSGIYAIYRERIRRAEELIMP